MLAIEQENAGLRRNRYPDLVSHFQTATAFELLFRKEYANEIPKFSLFVLRKEAVVRNSFSQDAEPRFRKRRLLKSPSPPFS